MSNFLKLIKSGHFYDNTDMIDEFLSRSHWEVLSDTKGTGMSTFLSTLPCYLDRRYDYAEVFSSLKISNSNHFMEYLNRCIVIHLDFLDFSCTNYADAMAYFRKEMSDVYKIHFDLVKVDEGFLEIMEESVPDTYLSRSLYNLLTDLYFQQNKMPVALLINNLVLVENLAYKYRYDEKMKEFLREYYIEDIYHFCEILLMVGDLRTVQSYLNPLEGKLRTDNPFMVYDRGIGISRDLGRDISYNYVLSRIMFEYFKTIDGRKSISAEEMFDLFVKDWNNDLDDIHPFQKEFTSYTAKSLLLVLDTMDVLCNDIALENTTLLLDDKYFWNCLEESCCWADLNESYTKMKTE